MAGVECCIKIMIGVSSHIISIIIQHSLLTVGLGLGPHLFVKVPRQAATCYYQSNHS